MVLVVRTIWYICKFLNNEWLYGGSIVYYDYDIDILSVNRDYAKKSIKGINLLYANDVYDTLRNYKGINSVKQVKDMIDSKDLYCEIEMLYIRFDGSPETSWHSYFFTGDADSYDEAIKNVKFKTYVYNTKFSTLDEYYGYMYPESFYGTYWDMDAQRINSASGNDVKCEIGQIVKFRYGSKLIEGCVTSIITDEWPVRNVMTRYNICELTPDDDGSYNAYFGEWVIYNDDLVEITPVIDYDIIRDAVLYKKIRCNWFDEDYIDSIKQLLISKGVDI